MNYEQQFLKDFSEWVDQQVMISKMAMEAAEKISKEEGKTEAAEAVIRYESRLDAYSFLQDKFENYKHGKEFHEIPELGTRKFYSSSQTT